MSNYIRHLNAFFSMVRSDERLGSAHVSLYLALFQYWNFNRFQNPFAVYRENLMQLSRIGSKNTYHKCLRHLHQTCYIIYHPSPSPFQPVRVSVIRLDVKEETGRYRQLPLFPQDVAEKPSPLSGTDGVPGLIAARTDCGTGTIPTLGHLIKLNSKPINGVGRTHPHLAVEEDENGNAANDLRIPFPVTSPSRDIARQKGKNRMLAGGAKPVPDVATVEAFFGAKGYPVKEAQKFFYYNQGKQWMLTDNARVTDWEALACKWMLNVRPAAEKGHPHDPATDVQYVYERYLEGAPVVKLIVPAYCDCLQLEVTEALWREAVRRRINQLAGSNEYGDHQLRDAYTKGAWTDERVMKDGERLVAMAKRLAVLMHFASQKEKGVMVLVKRDT